jgi:tRNA1Val (adenine37-N6)-methyltransferase
MTYHCLSPAHYTCLDIDQNATIECTENIINNALSDICETICCDLKEFRSEGKYFDVIYSNPPFYNDDIKPIDDKKRIAKHIDSLNFEELINPVKVLLKKSGYFIVIYLKEFVKILFLLLIKLD